MLKDAVFESVHVHEFLMYTSLFFSLQFRNAENFNQDLSFDTSGVDKMDGMCKYCCLMLACCAVATFLILSNIIVVFSSAPFCTQTCIRTTLVRRARSFNGELNFNTSSVTSMKSMFMDAESYTGGGLSLFDVSRVTTAKQMFAGASSLQGNGLGQWNFQSLENAAAMVRFLSWQ